MKICLKKKVLKSFILPKEVLIHIESIENSIVNDWVKIMDEFKNKIALITGGSKGIGFATAKKLSAHGVTVIITGRNLDDLVSSSKKNISRRFWVFLLCLWVRK